MKKIISFILIVSLLLISSSAYAYNTEKSDFLPTETEDIVEYVKSRGVVIPPELEDYTGLESFVEDIILAVENDPDIVFVYSYYPTLQLAESIKAMVNDSNHCDLSTADLIAEETEQYTLQYSVTVGAWSDTYLQYNCYAYALGYRSSPTVSSFFPYPGYFSNSGAFSSNGTIAQWAELTRDDLGAQGFNCVHMTVSYDDVMDYADDCEIICIRKSEYPDFHFMKLNGYSWYHKPGNTHVLRYLNYRPDDKLWILEYSFMGVDGLEADTSYTSTIYYFAYKTSHNPVLESHTGVNYHDNGYHYFECIGRCADCGATVEYWEKVTCSGPPCAVWMNLQETN